MSFGTIPEFAIERYFAAWEFKAPHLLCTSDVQGWAMSDLLALADEECRALWEGLHLGYTESTGHPLLRQAIASLYSSQAAENVLVCAGAEEGILVALSALLRPGDHAIIIAPSYQSLTEVARAAGAEIDHWMLREEEGWQPDLEALGRLIRPTTRLLVINFPNNPTGSHPDRVVFEAILDLAREAGIWVFSDEVYRGLEWPPAERLPPAVDLYERAIGLGVMSKALALPGIRIGWVVCRDPELMRRMASLKDYTTICNSAPSEILALIGLRAIEDVLARSQRIVTRNLALLDDWFVRRADRIRWVRPRAGSIAFPRVIGEDVEALTIRAREEAGVLLLPGSVFGDTGNHFRLGFGRTDLPDALRRFDQVLSRPPG